MGENKKYTCKFCKVQVVGPHNTWAVLGKEHKPGCRRRKLGHRANENKEKK